MRYLTDSKADELPTLGGLTVEQRGQAIADADLIYGFVRRSEAQRTDAVPEDAIRKWCEQQQIGPDRVTCALAFMRDIGQLVPIPETP